MPKAIEAHDVSNGLDRVGLFILKRVAKTDAVCALNLDSRYTQHLNTIDDVIKDLESQKKTILYLLRKVRRAEG